MKETRINDVVVKSKRGIDTSGMKQFKTSKIHKTKTKIEVTSIQFNRVDFDKDYKKKMKQGDTFLITNPEYLKNGIRTKDSIFSPLFGPDMMKPDAHTYMCECGKLIGGINEGRVCPSCNSKVQFITTDLTKSGTIDIAPYRVLTYHGYNLLSKKIKNLDEVISSTKKIDIKGHSSADTSIDILDLYDYYEKHEDEIGVPIEFAFTTKIPVINANTRPLVKTDSKLTLFKVNKEYNVMVSSLMNLNVSKYINNRSETVSLLNGIQEACLNVWREMEERLDGKTGDFRTQFTTCKTDYSSRMVITPGTKLAPHEVDVPYQTIMEFYEEELVNILHGMGHDYDVAIDLYLRGLNKITSHMKRAIKILLKKDRWLIINRNPTIKYGSILYVKIRKYNKNLKDTTMKLPAAILPLMNADYDGDQLTGLCSKLALCDENSYHEVFLYTFCPTYLLIDRGTGRFNRAMSFKKDHSVILTDLFRISNTLNYYNNNASDSELSNLIEYGKADEYNTYDNIASQLLHSDGPQDDDPEDMITVRNEVLVDVWEATFDDEQLYDTE